MIRPTTLMVTIALTAAASFGCASTPADAGADEEDALAIAGTPPISTVDWKSYAVIPSGASRRFRMSLAPGQAARCFVNGNAAFEWGFESQRGQEQVVWIHNDGPTRRTYELTWRASAKGDESAGPSQFIQTGFQLYGDRFPGDPANVTRFGDGFCTDPTASRPDWVEGPTLSGSPVRNCW